MSSVKAWYEIEADKDIEQAIGRVFHEIWAAQIGTLGYDKSKWQELASLLAKRGVHVQKMEYREPTKEAH